MRKASMNFKSGALYTKDGRKLADIDSGIVEWGVQVTAEVPTKSVATVTRNTTGTIEGKQQIGHLDVLSLMYGMWYDCIYVDIGKLYWLYYRSHCIL